MKFSDKQIKTIKYYAERNGCSNIECSSCPLSEKSLQYLNACTVNQFLKDESSKGNNEHWYMGNEDPNKYKKVLTLLRQNKIKEILK